MKLKIRRTNAGLVAEITLDRTPAALAREALRLTEEHTPRSGAAGLVPEAARSAFQLLDSRAPRTLLNEHFTHGFHRVKSVAEDSYR